MDSRSKSDHNDESAVREIEHTADYALRIRGTDFGSLLENAARGLYRLVGATETGIGRGQAEEKHITLEAQDAEGLLVEWLSELAYWVECEYFIASDIRFWEIENHRLRATVRGWQADGVEKLIKAVTYHELAILKTPGGLEATVVFDV